MNAPGLSASVIVFGLYEVQTYYTKHHIQLADIEGRHVDRLSEGKMLHR
jgi:hypothetical protein